MYDFEFSLCEKMYIFKTSGETFESVIKNQKHAFKGKPKDWKIGELVLVSKNMKDLRGDEKQIQYIMKIEDIREATDDEIEKYWPGNKGRWKYIVDCYDTVKLDDSFNLKDDVLGSEVKRYDPIVTFGKIKQEHEIKIRDFLDSMNILKKKPIEEEEKRIKEELSKLNDEYKNKDTKKKESVSTRIERNPRLVTKLKKLHPNKCQICSRKHFLKESGEPYSEVHHINELSKGGSQATNNCLVLCSTCHRKLHYASVEINESDEDFEIIINGESYTSERNIIS